VRAGVVGARRSLNELTEAWVVRVMQRSHHNNACIGHRRVLTVSWSSRGIQNCFVFAAPAAPVTAFDDEQAL